MSKFPGKKMTYILNIQCVQVLRCSLGTYDTSYSKWIGRLLKTMYVFHPESFKNMLTYIIVIKEEKKNVLRILDQNWMGYTTV